MFPCTLPEQATKYRYALLSTDIYCTVLGGTYYNIPDCHGSRSSPKCSVLRKFHIKRWSKGQTRLDDYA